MESHTILVAPKEVAHEHHEHEVDMNVTGYSIFSLFRHFLTYNFLLNLSVIENIGHNFFSYLQQTF